MQLSVFVDAILARLLSGNRTVSVFTFHYVKDNRWDIVAVLLKFGVLIGYKCSCRVCVKQFCVLKAHNRGYIAKF